MEQTSAIKIHCKYDKLIPIEAFVPHDKNANKHPAQQIELLVRLMKFQGIRHPLIISNLSGKCVAGHGRFEAFKVLGMKEVPVVYQDFDSVHQELAFLVSDNKIQEIAETDEKTLREIALEMPKEFDLNLFGIPDFKIENLADYETLTLESIQETPENFLDRVNANTMKIVLIFEKDEYAHVESKCKERMKANNLETYKDLFVYLLNK